MTRVLARLGGFTLLGASLLAAGCGGRGNAVAPGPAAETVMVKSVSPASVPAPPMRQTAVLSPSVMTSVRTPHSVIQQLGWTQLPGGGIFVAASPDGSLWVLSSVGSGLDRAIWHYVNGSWTNIPGAAMRMAVAPNGTLWVVNSSGGIYSYNGSSWSTVAGGASDISIGSDGSVYVVSNQGGGPYGRGIWRYTSGSWTQLPGAAVRIAASWDTGTYPGGIAPGGFWIVNAVNGIYYFNPSTGFNQIPGGVAQVAPTKNGGIFALGYLQNGDGSRPIYYNDLATGIWYLQPGAATSISTDGVHVYVTGAAGGIYSATFNVVMPLSAAPAALAFPQNGTYSAQSATVSGGTPPYTARTGDATLVQASVTGSNVTVSPVPNAQGQYNAGQTTITISDAANAQTTLQVSVATLQLIVDSKRGHR